MMERWQKFWQLSGYERGVALEAAGGLFATWLGLRLAGFRRWKNVLAHLAPSANTTARQQTASQRESAEVVARMAKAAARNAFFGSKSFSVLIARPFVLLPAAVLSFFAPFMEGSS